MKYIYLLFLMLVPMVVSANSCDDVIYNEKVALANNIKINYVLGAGGKMEVTALKVDATISFQIGNKTFNTSSESVNLGVYAQGESVAIDYLSNVDLGCGRGRLVTKKYLTLPYYNSYYNSSSCLSRKDAEVCAYFYPNIITKDEFNRGILSYDSAKYHGGKSEEVEQETIQEIPWYMEYSRYIMIGGIVIVVGGGFLIYYLRKRYLEKGDLFWESIYI